MKQRERVLLVEDHAGTGDALAAMLRQCFDVPHRIGSLAELSEAMRVQEPTIVLIDLALGDQNVLEVLPDLVRCHPLKKFIVLTAYDSFAVMEGALKRWSEGVRPEGSATIEEIKEAITVVGAKTLQASAVRRVAPSRQSAARRATWIATVGCPEASRA
jgi:DNA-binding NarL/FixJ family response regulator